jgi:predicted GNAT superfamily acetyltransferase
MESRKSRSELAAKLMSTRPQCDIRIESLTGFEQFDRCTALQEMIWGSGDGDVVSRRIFTVISHIGGQVLGAFDEETLIGFAFALPGYRDGRAYLHSHILAVLPGYRNAGIGRRLKLAQRDDAIARGLDLMEWTFDPLEIKNAYLNIARLGAVVRRYHPNLYGPSSSPLQGGLPTDRLYAEWWLRSPRVESLLRGEALPPQAIERRITVPHAIAEWKQDPRRRDLAHAVQSGNREAFAAAFRHGLAVVGHERDIEGNGVFLLGRWDAPSVKMKIP